MVIPHGVLDGLRLTRSRAELMTDGAIRCRLLFTGFPVAICASRRYAAHLQAGRPGVGLRSLCALFPRPEFPSDEVKAC